MKDDELIGYIMSSQRKPFWEYSISYYWAHFSRILKSVFWRFFCFFGYHRIYDGIFHIHLVTSTWFNSTETYKDIYKCYHCRYCDKPKDKELHNERID